VPEPAHLTLSPAELSQVLAILQQHVPGLEVWAFGSRVRGQAKPHSDLDLALITTTPLPLATAAALDDAFAESDLPWRVDVVDWASTSPAFRDIIGQDKITLQEPMAPC
jgi:predicted nucleotidyltransferase